MYFDDIAFGILKKHLMPVFGESCSVVGVGDVFIVENFEQCGKIICAERNVPAINRVDHLSIFECYIELALGEVHLHAAFGGETNLAVITGFIVGLGARKILLWDVSRPSTLV